MRHGEIFDPTSFLREAGIGRTLLRCRKDDVIFAQGETAFAVYYLQQGRVKVAVLSEQGKEAVVGLVGPGQFFGEGCLVSDRPRTSTTIAMDDCVITAINTPTMLATLRSETSFADLFTNYLLTRNDRIEQDLTDQLFNSSEKRLARLLLLLADVDTQGRTQPIASHISQETLAEMIGTTRSRVSFFMNRFRKRGLIDYNGRIEVHRALLGAMLRNKQQGDRK
jgi:CRP-like cAMP-binding protein